jgi:excisionase family DNA binding protein
MSVAEAARRLGISEGGVRKRVQRRQIPHERDERGRLWVWLDPTETRRDQSQDRPSSSPGQSRDELVVELRDRIADLREQVLSERQAHAESRRLLAAALERIPPQIEAPRESPTPPDSPGPTDTPGDHGRGQQTPDTRPWWRRWLEG